MSRSLKKSIATNTLVNPMVTLWEKYKYSEWKEKDIHRLSKIDIKDNLSSNVSLKDKLLLENYYKSSKRTPVLFIFSPFLHLSSLHPPPPKRSSLHTIPYPQNIPQQQPDSYPNLILNSALLPPSSIYTNPGIWPNKFERTYIKY